MEVGGLISSLKLYPFMDRGLATGDLFGDMKDGYYTINADNAEITNYPCEYGVLFKMTSTYGYGIMEVRDVIKNDRYTTRTSNIGTWSPWEKE